MPLLLQLFLLPFHGLPFLQVEPLIAVDAEVVALVDDKLCPLGRIGLIVQRHVLVVHRGLILAPSVSGQLLINSKSSLISSSFCRAAGHNDTENGFAS